jgi:MFS family permease
MQIRQALVSHGSDETGGPAGHARTAGRRVVAGATRLPAQGLRADVGATIGTALRGRTGRAAERDPVDGPTGRSAPAPVEGSGRPGVAALTRDGAKDARRAGAAGGGDSLLETSSMAAMPHWRFFLSVLLPFAAGYYLSYLFRTINALISSDLAAELALSAADLGFLTSIYFLTFAAAQLPLGAMLDRYGPRAMQSVLLLIASAGALVFALADDLFGLLIGRALLGIGVSLALMAGFKAIVLFLPPQRLAISNGWLVMLGALGAVTATAPAEMIVQAIGWRGLFAVLASLAAAAALLILLVVPEPPEAARRAERTTRLLDVYCDRRFWRIAPLSAIGVGTSWSLQGLWASPWLRDVEGLNRTDIVAHLGVMAISVAASAMVLGMLADRMRRRGVSNGVLLAATFGLSMTAQAGLLLDWPLPSHLLWSPIAAAGAATVLSFAMLAEYFPKEMSGRANAALNLLHIGAAFVLQSAAGFIIACWPEAHGGYPAEAHRAAMACTLVLEIAALLWFAVPPPAPRRVVLTVGGARGFSEVSLATLRYRRAVWAQRAGSLPGFATGWGAAAAASALLFVAVAAAFSAAVSRPALAVYVVEAEGDGALAALDGLRPFLIHVKTGRAYGDVVSPDDLSPCRFGLGEAY